MPANRSIKIEFDDETKDYYIIWQPPAAIGSGKTESQALFDLKEAAHSGIEVSIDSKVKEISKGKEC